MQVRTLPNAAAVLASDLGHLTKLVVEQLQDPDLFRNPQLEETITVVLERFCLSIRLAKPVGLGTWATREARRLGPVQTSEIANATAHVLASEGARFDLNHGRLLTFLEALKSEIGEALASVGGDLSRRRLIHPEAVEALLAMLDERDSATCCHSRATGEWARRLSEAMALGREQTEFAVLCAVLHDIGKIATPESILLKPAGLDEAEWEIMRDHSAAGQRILNHVPSLKPCGLIVRAHHERWDGAGYPDGLAGECIPFEARLVAVADAFHAMISNRPYRKAILPRQALLTLQEGRGTQWDAAIVDAMLGLFQHSERAQKNERAATA